MATCRDCPHDESRHEHYRAGMDCGACDCPQYRRRFWWRGRAAVDAGASVTVSADARERSLSGF